jgi:hypothetical protein
MKEYRITWILFLFVVIIGCSSEQKEAGKMEPSSSKTIQPINGDDAAIRAVLTEMFDRLREGDKTVLYENEFTYYLDENPLSAYYEYKRVKEYKYDTLKGIEIDSTAIMGESAWAYVKVIYESYDGGETLRPYKLALYRSRGRWVKPYQSKYAEEKDYLEQKRIYDSVTAGQ